ncbi:antitoxin [Streptosporangium sp. NPDC087985]|uniref:antitoxin n=1 Tax=Streptosporangium sp. NPDC087985 TaxID=3366196 RepID=UPI0038000EAD
MSIFDKVKSMLAEHSTKAEELANQGIDKAAEMAKEKTGGKYDQYIDSAAEEARKRADMIGGQTGTSPVPGETDTPQASDDVLGGTAPSEDAGETGTPRKPDEKGTDPYPG